MLQALRAAILLKRDSNTGVILRLLLNFLNTFFYTRSGCFLSSAFQFLAAGKSIEKNIIFFLVKKNLIYNVSHKL